MQSSRRWIVPMTLAALSLVALVGSAHALAPLVRAGAALRVLQPIEGLPAPGPLGLADLPEAQRRAIPTADPESPALQAGGYSREVIAGDLVHYQYLIRTGLGTYDAFRLHRVVRETRPGVPLRTACNVFLQHGDAKDFVGMFLPGTRSSAWPRDFGFAPYLARNGVDVWGIDQDWTLVPAEEADLSFMESWDLGRAASNVRAGLAVARVLRLATGSGAGKMTLLGYSSGVFTTVAVLDREAALPAALRQVGGWIAADVPFKTNDAGVRDAFLADMAVQDASLAAGQYGSFVIFKPVGDLARDFPNDDSPIFPGLTNAQVAALLFYVPGGPGFPVGHFHYWAGVFDGEGNPTGPRFTTQAQVFEFLTSAIAWQPVKFFRDEDVMVTETENSPYDDHLPLVRVPVLNVSPGGSFTELTQYGISRLGSTDVTHLFPSVGGASADDVGHIDLFSWQGSEALWWGQALAWIQSHATSSPFVREAVADDPPASPDDGGRRLAIERVTPNPLRTGDLRVDFTAVASLPVRVDVLDVAGRRVAGADVVAGAGRHSLTVARAGELAPGLYLVRATQGTQVTMSRVAVVR